MTTIYEVAARAGVSPATVSRVLNGHSVSPAKVEAVRRAAAELDFRPDRTARSLRRGNSEVVALVLPDIENPYFTEMARGVEDVAQEAGYSVVLCNSDGDAAKESVYLQIAVAENMAGVILAPASARSDIDELIRRERPVVAVDRTSGHEIDTVMMSNAEAGAAAAAALADLGCRRIACITGPRHILTSEERVRGWRETLAARGLPTDDALLRFSTFRVDGGRDAMSELLDGDAPPDGVVAANNLMGVGAMQVLDERGLDADRVRVAVVGGLPFTTRAPAAVTTVRLPAREMGTTAARLLLDRIAGDHEPARSVVLAHELVPARRSGAG